MNRAGFLARIGGAVVAGLVGRKAVAEEPPARPDYPLTIGGTEIPVTGEALDIPSVMMPENCVTVYWRDGTVCVTDSESVAAHGWCHSWYRYTDDPQINTEAKALALAEEILSDKAWR